MWFHQKMRNLSGINLHHGHAKSIRNGNNYEADARK
jgi:hypothetical protein